MRKKSLLALLMAGMMAAAALAGCGNSSSSAASSAGSAEAETEGAVWKIGQIGPLTGGLAIYGQDVSYGAKIAVDEINAAGGIAGTPIELKSEDDEGDGEKAINAYNSLKD